MSNRSFAGPFENICYSAVDPENRAGISTSDESHGVNAYTLQNIKSSLKILTTSGEIQSDKEMGKVSEATCVEIPDRPPSFPTVVLQTSTYRTKQWAVPMCACQRHAVSEYQHPRWIAPLIGSLFIGYSGLPYLSTVRCNQSACTKREDAPAKATYYFPAWLPYFSRMVSFVGR